MDRTNNLSLPYIMPAQAQKHVTHNEAIRMLDALVMAAVEAAGTSEPPANPGEGEQYLVGVPGQDAFAGMDRHLAAFQDGAWAFLQPREGWLVWEKTGARHLIFTSGEWQELEAGTIDQLAMIGVNTAADVVNRFAVRSAASLFSHDESGDHRLVVNRQSQSDVASAVFQTDFSGRAEIGLTGNDDLSVKVSSDGVSFQQAIVVENATGRVSFPETGIAQDMLFNLYQDSGRLCVNPGGGKIAGAFQFPAYLTAYNGAQANAHAKFIHDNGTHGGPLDPLHADVDALVSKLRNAGAPRRYGVEYWVARIVTGSGQAVPVSENGSNYYLCLFTSQYARIPNMTFHAYVRAITAPVLVRRQTGQTIYVDGAEQPAADIVIDPSDGWLALQIQDRQPLRTSVGYMPMTFNLFTQSPGDEVLLACPALIPGIVNVDPDSGVIAAYNNWAAS